MAISTRAALIAAMKSGQEVIWKKTATRSTVANAWFTMFNLAGVPASGALGGTSTTAGVVPNNTTAGCPSLNSFNGLQGCVAKVDLTTVGNGNVGERVHIYDLLFKAGAYAFNAATALSAQPSFSARVPGGTDYTGCELWFEAVTAFTGTPSIAVTYTNSAGTAAQSTGTFSLGVAPTVGRMFQLPLAAGDLGVQKVESVTATVATVGTFNILVMRPLVKNLRIVNGLFPDVWGPDRTGLPLIYDTTALYPIFSSDGTSSGTPELLISLATG